MTEPTTKPCFPWLTTVMAFPMLCGKRRPAARAYAVFVNDGLAVGRRGEFHGERPTNSRIFGDDGFVEKIVGPGVVLPERVTVDEVGSVIC